MLFEDTFEVTSVNPDGKKFDKGKIINIHIIILMIFIVVRMSNINRIVKYLILTLFNIYLYILFV